jgi:hypothetical protein
VWALAHGRSALALGTLRKHIRKVPGSDAWLGYESDLDVKHAHKLMFGKTISDVQGLFGGVRSIERADELLFMPRRAFQYYVFAFAEFALSDKGIGDSDSASPFLRLLLNREKRDPGSVAQIYEELVPVVDHVASHQSQYDADENIYGNFGDLARQLRALCIDTRGA